MLRSAPLIAWVTLFTVSVVPSRADWLQLSTGDAIKGELLEMSLQQVKFRHEVLGEITIPRDRVHAIVFGEFQGGKRIMADGSKAEPETPQEVIDRLVNPEFDTQAVQALEKGAKRQSTPQDAVEQLRREGIDSRLTDQLHLMLPEESGAIWHLTWASDSVRLTAACSNGVIVTWNLDHVRRQLGELGLDW